MSIFKSIKQFFSQKSFIVNKNGNFTTYNISPAFQVFAFILTIATVVWMSSITYIYITNKQAIENTEEFKQKSNNKVIAALSELKVFSEQIQLIITRLEDQNKELVDKLETSLSDAEKEEIKKKIILLDVEKKYLSNQIEEFLSKENLILSNKEDEDRIYDAKKAILQRNIAWQEKLKVQQENEKIIQNMLEMKKAQDDLLDKVEYLTDFKTEEVDEVLKRIQRSLDIIGIKKEKDIQESVEKMDKDKGGIYVPLDSDSLSNEILISKRYKEVIKKVNTLEAKKTFLEVLPLGYPVENTHITSSFGRRNDPLNGGAAIHKGIDFKGKIGEPIKAPSSGKVTVARTLSGYGKTVKIDHGGGFMTIYAHLNKILVKQGDSVYKGDVIAELGNTGRSTGPHLHYEIRYKNRPFNPFSFAKAIDENLFENIDTKTQKDKNNKT